MRCAPISSLLALAALLSGCFAAGSSGRAAWAAQAGEEDQSPLEQIGGNPACVSAGETELARVLNEYRKANGLSPLPLFKSLTLVAKWHAYDLEVNQAGKMTDEQGQVCGLHSWSEKGGTRWSKICYRTDRFGSRRCGPSRES